MGIENLTFEVEVKHVNKIPRYEVYIFDVDGTLINADLLRFTSYHHNINPHYKDPTLERTARDRLRYHPYREGNLLSKWNKIKNNIKVYKDASVLLKLKERRVNNKEVKIAVLSNASDEPTQIKAKIIEQILGNKFRFDCVLGVGPGSKYPQKPAYEGLEACLEKLGVENVGDHSILYVGDSPRLDVLQANKYNQHVTQNVYSVIESSSAIITPFESITPKEVGHTMIRPVDSALIMRENSQYVIEEDMYDEEVRKRNNLIPDFFIKTLYELISAYPMDKHRTF